MIILQHEISNNRPCTVCKKIGWPFYRGSDRKTYCEDCAAQLAKGVGYRFGRIGSQHIEYCRRCKGTGMEKINGA